jgi:hypothetical protein
LSIEAVSLAGNQLAAFFLTHSAAWAHSTIGFTKCCSFSSIVLLLLVVVAELSLTLRCHPPLRLHHLLGLIGTTWWLVPLAGVEALEVGPGEGARITEITAG